MNPLRFLGGLPALLLPLQLLVPAPVAVGQVVINELAYDDSGDDDEEFVELFHAGDGTVDLSEWTLEVGDDLGPGAVHFLPEGTELEAGGHLVVGSSLVPDVRVVLPGSDLLGNGPAWIVLRNANGDEVDHVAYEVNKGVAGFPPEAVAEGGIWGNHVLVSSTRMSWQRWWDGHDTDHNGRDFGHLPWTPGRTNDRARPAELESGFEDGEGEQPVDGLAGTFVPGRRVDPTLVSASNPGAIPASPDGGLALVAWDPAGGGNLVVLDARPESDRMFEAWVYLDARPVAAGEVESWSIGLRGTSGTYYNVPVLYDANGNTGVSWTFQVTSSGATLYLIDEGYGEPAAERVVLGSVPIAEAAGDGWQRLRLEVEGERVTGYFGGTYGSKEDGLRFDGTVREVGVGSLYLGYREGLADAARLRPLTLDALTVGPVRPAGTRFVRGDATGDGAMNVSDAVSILNHLFTGGPPPSCEKSGDADDNGSIQLTDAVRILGRLFLGDPALDAPSGACGTDPTPDELTCESFEPCP